MVRSEREVREKSGRAPRAWAPAEERLRARREDPVEEELEFVLVELLRMTG